MRRDEIGSLSQLNVWEIEKQLPEKMPKIKKTITLYRFTFWQKVYMRMLEKRWLHELDTHEAVF